MVTCILNGWFGRMVWTDGFGGQMVTCMLNRQKLGWTILQAQEGDNKGDGVSRR
jgi:hypothetical protein